MSRPVVKYYHTNWSVYGRGFNVADVPDEQTDLIYSFFDVQPDGNMASLDTYSDFEKHFSKVENIPGQDKPRCIDCVLRPDTWDSQDPNQVYGNIGQFIQLSEKRRSQNLRFKLDVSIGGWTRSKHFSTVMKTEATRTALKNSLVDFFDKYPVFTGVSIDWEYVHEEQNFGDPGNMWSPDDPDNFLKFLKILRPALNALGKKNAKEYSIAFCVSGDPAKITSRIKDIAKYLDELHIMTYDMYDGNFGAGLARHHTPPRTRKGDLSAERAAKYVIAQGVPAQKIFIGVAFYSRGWSEFTGKVALYEQATRGSRGKTWEQGIRDYKEIVRAGENILTDPETKGAYVLDESDGGNIDTFDDPRSVKEKVKIVKELGLGGLLVWENSADVPPYDPDHGDMSLTGTMYKALGIDKWNSTIDDTDRKPKQPSTDTGGSGESTDDNTDTDTDSDGDDDTDSDGDDRSKKNKEKTSSRKIPKWLLWTGVSVTVVIVFILILIKSKGSAQVTWSLGRISWLVIFLLLAVFLNILFGYLAFDEPKPSAKAREVVPKSSDKA